MDPEYVATVEQAAEALGLAPHIAALEAGPQPLHLEMFLAGVRGGLVRSLAQLAGQATEPTVRALFAVLAGSPDAEVGARGGRVAAAQAAGAS